MSKPDIIASRTAVAIPQRLQRRPRDRRGYPIPFAVYVEADGTPQFTVNDIGRGHQIERDDLCSLCGSKLLRGRWFIGGPAAAMHPQGAYLDRPMHDECAHYALQVCPYLALPKFGREIGAAKAARIKDAVILHDDTPIDARPGCFVAVMAVGQKLVADGRYVKPARPYRKVEYWQHGRQISEAEARSDVDAAMAAAAAAS